MKSVCNKLSSLSVYMLIWEKAAADCMTYHSVVSNLFPVYFASVTTVQSFFLLSLLGEKYFEVIVKPDGL